MPACAMAVPATLETARKLDRGQVHDGEGRARTGSSICSLCLRGADQCHLLSNWLAGALNPVLHFRQTGRYNPNDCISAQMLENPAIRKSSQRCDLRKTVAHFAVRLHLVVCDAVFTGCGEPALVGKCWMAESPEYICPGCGWATDARPVCTDCQGWYVQLCKQANKTLYGIAWRLTGENADAASEVLQEAVYCCWFDICDPDEVKWLPKAFVDGTADKQFFGWMKGAVTNCARTYRRKHGREFQSYESYESQLSETTPEPIDTLVQRDVTQEERRHLWRCLSELTETQRDIWTLHIDAGLSFGETAGMLELPEDAVIRLYERAEKILLLLLGPVDDDHDAEICYHQSFCCLSETLQTVWELCAHACLDEVEAASYLRISKKVIHDHFKNALTELRRLLAGADEDVAPTQFQMSFRQLTARQQEVWILRNGAGLKNTAVANKLQVEPRVVQLHLQRAKKSMQELPGDDNNEH